MPLARRFIVVSCPANIIRIAFGDHLVLRQEVPALLRLHHAREQVIPRMAATPPAHDGAQELHQLVHCGLAVLHPRRIVAADEDHRAQIL